MTEAVLFERHLTNDELASRLDEILASPKDDGELIMIVCRPEVDERETLSSARLDAGQGLIGDNWLIRGSSRTDNGLGHPEMQLNLMNARMAETVAGGRERMSLAGDQLFVDLDLSAENLPPGSRLSVGTAEIEITSIPHLGCKKFVARFGMDAMLFVNSEIGKRNNLRGVNARVISSGEIKAGDRIRKLA